MTSGPAVGENIGSSSSFPSKESLAVFVLSTMGIPVVRRPEKPRGKGGARVVRAYGKGGRVPGRPARLFAHISEPRQSFFATQNEHHVENAW